MGSAVTGDRVVEVILVDRRGRCQEEVAQDKANDLLDKVSKDLVVVEGIHVDMGEGGRAIVHDLRGATVSGDHPRRLHHALDRRPIWKLGL
jgi:hypothetical protein